MLCVYNSGVRGRFLFGLLDPEAEESWGIMKRMHDPGTHASV